MRNFLILFLLAAFANGVSAQKPSRVPIASAAKTASEAESFEKAVAQQDAAARVILLQKFVRDFPKSAEKNRALELVASARAELADGKLRAKDAPRAVALFKLALKELPAPISDKLFTDVLLRVPTNLFFAGERDAAAEIAAAIEKKIDGNAKQLLGLATFYFGVENAEQAKRLAEKALALDANLPAAYQTLGLAARLNFNLEDAAAAYAKALELDPNSVVSKRSLAEMRRAVGKTDEAIALYREILAANADDNSARNNLILSLFDAGKKIEAEAEMQSSLAQNPNNLLLLAGAAYWYAGREDGAARAVEFAERAVALEPRYIWSYIALARGLTRQNRFYDAERALLAARVNGNFPTLDYELATVRLAAGFYREAAQELAKTFTVKNDSVSTKLGARVEKSAPDFVELLALERRAAIFAPVAADTAENAARLKSLLDFYQKINAEKSDEAEAARAADKFVEDADKMKIHRRIFAASLLLEKNKALPKILELMKGAASEVESATDAPASASAILAEQLYASRQEAARQNRLVIVPDVARETLSNIVRGRIEEINGAALLQTNEPAAAIVRLKRAVSILPEKSAWWRSSIWLLGAALEAEGSSESAPAALDAYIKSYTSESEAGKSAAKRNVIETLYRKINGNLDGLDAKIGAKMVVENNADVNKSTEKIEPQIQPNSAPNVPVGNQSGENRLTNQKNSGDREAAGKVEKSLFEPIIIIVPKTETAKTNDAANGARSATKNTTNGNGDAAGNIKPCRITVSQETVSLLNNGGNLSVLVGFENEEDNQATAANDVKEIAASSSDPQAVEAVLEPENADAARQQSSRAVFVVKSVSRKTGVFTIFFDAPQCVRKEVVVKVR